MKKLVFIFVLFFSVSAIAQKNCTNPMLEEDFQLKLSGVKLQKTDQAKVDLAMKSLAGNCYLSSQIKQMAAQFQDDEARFEFAKAAYAVVSDPWNFYEVYNTFGYFSNVMKLHDFTKGTLVEQPKLQVKNQGAGSNLVRPRDAGPTYPNIKYPESAGYNGPKGCNTPKSDAEFDVIAKGIHTQSSDMLKISEAEKAIKANCFTAAQLIKLASLFTNENDRLALLKKAFYHCFDLNNYTAISNFSFTNTKEKNLFNDFAKQAISEIAAQGNQSNTQAAPCNVLDKEFQEAKELIKKQSFNGTRVQVAKNTVAAKKCFTSFQIKEIVKLLDFEDSRLDVAKYSYDYCQDKDNYLRVIESFDFDATKNELMNYIKSKK